jgi:acyl dehydratase
MDASQTKDIWYFAAQLWSSLVVALAVYGGGLTASSLMGVLYPSAKEVLGGKTQDVDPKLPLAFRLWWATRHAHPFFAGAAFAFLPGLPHPEWVTSRTAAVIWFALMGMLNGQIHMTVEQATAFGKRYAESWVKQRTGASASHAVASTPASSDSEPSDQPPS